MVDGMPGAAVIVLVFITSKGVVAIAARPPERPPMAIVSHGCSSLSSTLWTTWSQILLGTYNRKKQNIFVQYRYRR